jgi:hypothetical protein
MFLPKPDGEDAADAMCMALKDAGIEAHAIDYINAHGTGTIVNDVSETRAIKKVFGNKAKGVPISSTKSMIGHSIGAAGAIEAIICVSAIMHQIIPPTINLTAPDPDCDLDYIPCKARQAQVITTMSNSFGKRVAVETLDRFWHMVFVGFIATVVAPVLIVTLLVSIVGMYVGFLVGTLYLLAVLAAGVLMCVTAGALIAKIAKKEILINWKWALLGTVAVFAASFIPLLGWIAVLLLYFASLGAALTSLYRDAKAKMS